MRWIWCFPKYKKKAIKAEGTRESGGFGGFPSREEGKVLGKAVDLMVSQV